MKWKLVFTPHHISINPSAIPYRNESNLRRIPFTSPALDISISITAASQHIRQSLSFLPNGSQSVGCQASSNVEITEGWLGWVVVCHTHIHISIISSLHPFIIRSSIYLFIYTLMFRFSSLSFSRDIKPDNILLDEEGKFIQNTVLSVRHPVSVLIKLRAVWLRFPNNALLADDVPWFS